MTQGEILYFAYLFAKSKLNSRFYMQSEYCTKRFKELSEQLEQLGMKSKQTEPLPCKVGDTLYITSVSDDKFKPIEKVTVTSMRYYEESQDTEAVVKYENGFTGFIHTENFYSYYNAHFTLEEAQQRVECCKQKERAVDKIWNYVETHFDDDSDSLVDYDWLTDFTLRVELKQNRTIKIQYNPDTDSLEVDNLST